VLARFLQTPTEASGEAIVPTSAAASCLCHDREHADEVGGTYEEVTTMTAYAIQITEPAEPVVAVQESGCLIGDEVMTAREAADLPRCLPQPSTSWRDAVCAPLAGGAGRGGC
jgi:hypothetical protein